MMVDNAASSRRLRNLNNQSCFTLTNTSMDHQAIAE